MVDKYYGRKYMFAFMNDQKERCEILGAYLLENACTVRTAARRFDISKSTVHKDVTVKLRYVNPALYKEVKEILEKNKSERHIRGGEATRRKYLLEAADREEKTPRDG